MVMVVHASHLLLLLIGIETMSLAAYALVAGRYRSGKGGEGALNYFWPLGRSGFLCGLFLAPQPIIFVEE
jgi:NADH:ubiquinone oxidoreductase subunit 2 (subunit N)